MTDRTAAGVTRRTALRLLGGAALAAATAGGRAGSADAARTWCRTDPVVMIDGKVADIWLGSYRELHGAATGPAEIVVGLPVGTSAELLATDLGFGRHGYRVSFVEDKSLRTHPGSCQVSVAAYVPSADASLPLAVDFLPRTPGMSRASAHGIVNSWVKLETS